MRRNVTQVVLALLEAFWCLVSLLAVTGALALACGCTPEPGQPVAGEPEKNQVLRATTRIEVDSKSVLGVGTLPLASLQKLTFSFERPTVFAIVRTRHREHVQRFDKPVREWTYAYIPRLWLERDPGELSPLEIRSIDERGFESVGLVAWERPYGLEANIGCNGYTHKRDSVSACQSRAGLVQELVFLEPVTATVALPDCEPTPMNPRQQSGRRVAQRWHIQLPAGVCVVRFQSVDQKREHRFIGRGYTDANHH